MTSALVEAVKKVVAAVDLLAVVAVVAVADPLVVAAVDPQADRLVSPGESVTKMMVIQAMRAWMIVVGMKMTFRLIRERGVSAPLILYGKEKKRRNRNGRSPVSLWRHRINRS
uniref:Uncharacterized protein n=1 Tax=uncultured marine virus TaxID=186617 RepID=A0A0F7L846_9VIRU|nr:hypothetical protein [uncultured marine virus]